MKGVFGIGNPGPTYAKTRHNIGFRAIEDLKRSQSKRWTSLQSKSSTVAGEAVKFKVAESESAILVEPLMYVNNTGPCVKTVAKLYGLEVKNILIVCDDVALPLGRIRFRQKGSSGGQKGLQSVEDALGTQEFSRLRIGIGADLKPKDLAEFVLKPFSARELPRVNEVMRKVVQAIGCWFEAGIEKTMNEYNKKDMT
jgi:peptidyl-tRNA hydrolase, PTH1 family